MPTIDEVLKRIGEEGVRWVDLHFVDITGSLQHVTIPSHTLEKESFKNGVAGINGAAFKGFKNPEESDLVLVPDQETYAKVPWENNTARFYCNINESMGKGGYEKDSRAVVSKANELVQAAGYSLAFFGSQMTCFALDSATYDQHVPFRSQGYSVDSREAAWNSYGQNFPVDIQEGLCSSSPKDTLQLFRAMIAEVLEDNFSVGVDGHCHGPATGGHCEFTIRREETLKAADNYLTTKYVAKNVAASNAMMSTFMPYVVSGDYGNFAYTHISLSKTGKNAFYEEGDKYAELSQTGRYFIGGLMDHARAITALTNPTTNSYRRLKAEPNAPVNITWGRANRTAAIRIPVYHKGEEFTKRIEYRPPDPSANPYLAFAGVLAAGMDGVKKKKEPGDPVDADVAKMDVKKRKEYGIGILPHSLDEALDELEANSTFLKNVFPTDLLAAYIELKRAECKESSVKPIPYEFKKYLSV